MKKSLLFSSLLVLTCCSTVLSAKNPLTAEKVPWRVGYNKKEAKGPASNGKESKRFNPTIDAFKNSQEGDSFAGLQAWAWTDYLRAADELNGTTNVMFSVDKTGKDGVVRTGKPVSLSKLAPDCVATDAAVVINRANKNNIIVSYKVTNNLVGSSQPYRAVSFDGGRTWTENGPMDIPEAAGQQYGSYGLFSDASGNIFYTDAAAFDANGSYIGNHAFLMSSDGGVTFKLAYISDTSVSNVTSTGGNVIAFNKNNGIEIINGSNANVVQGNAISNNRRNGVRLENGSFNNQVTTNFIGKNCRNGIEVKSRSSTTLLQDNAILRNGHKGVRLSRALLTQVFGNTIDQNRRDGIEVTRRSSDTNLAGNKISKNQSNGVKIHEFSQVTNVSNNTISCNDGHGLQLDQTSCFRIDDNCIKHNKKSNVKGRRSSKKCGSDSSNSR